MSPTDDLEDLFGDLEELIPSISDEDEIHAPWVSFPEYERRHRQDENSCHLQELCSKLELELGIAQLLSTSEVSDSCTDIIYHLDTAKKKGAITNLSSQLDLANALVVLYRNWTPSNGFFSHIVWDKSFEHKILQDYNYLMEKNRPQDAVQLAKDASNVANLRILVGLSSRSFVRSEFQSQAQSLVSRIQNVLQETITTYRFLQERIPGLEMKYMANVGQNAHDNVILPCVGEELSQEEIASLLKANMTYAKILAQHVKRESPYFPNLVETNPLLFAGYELIEMEYDAEPIFNFYRALSRLPITTRFASEINGRLSSSAAKVKGGERTCFITKLGNIAAIDFGLLDDSMQLFGRGTLGMQALENILRLAKVFYQSANLVCKELKSSHSSPEDSGLLTSYISSVASINPTLAQTAAPILSKVWDNEKSRNFFFRLISAIVDLDSTISGEIVRKIYCNGNVLLDSNLVLPNLIRKVFNQHGWRNAYTAIMNFPDPLMSLLTLHISEQDFNRAYFLYFQEPEQVAYSVRNRQRIAELSQENPFTFFYEKTGRFFSLDKKTAPIFADLYLEANKKGCEFDPLQLTLAMFLDRYGEKKFLKLAPILVKRCEDTAFVSNFLSSMSHVSSGSCLDDYCEVVPKLDRRELEVMVAEINRDSSQSEAAVANVVKKYENTPRWIEAIEGKERDSDYQITMEGKDSFFLKEHDTDAALVGFPMFALFYGYLAATMRLASQSDKSRRHSNFQLISQHRFESSSSKPVLFRISQLHQDSVEGFYVNGLNKDDWENFIALCRYPSNIFLFIQNYCSLANQPDNVDGTFGAHMHFGRIQYNSQPPDEAAEISIANRKVEEFSFYVPCVNPYPILYRVEQVRRKNIIYQNLIEAKVERFIQHDPDSLVLQVRLRKPYLIGMADLREIDKAIYGLDYDKETRKRLVHNLVTAVPEGFIDGVIEGHDIEFLNFLASIPYAKQQYINMVAKSYSRIQPFELALGLDSLKPEYAKRVPVR